MEIGLDFDGVITDCGDLKSTWAKKLYGVSIAPEEFKRELVVGRNILTNDQYNDLLKQIYGTREIALTMNAVPEMEKYIRMLQSDGHKLRIITSRGEEEGKVALEWLAQRHISLPLKGVGPRVSKAAACEGLDIYIDDDLNKLEPLVAVVPHRFLFGWGYNRHVTLNPILASRVESWEEFYHKVQGITRVFGRT